jgi:galactonate dehydratase
MGQLANEHLRCELKMARLKIGSTGENMNRRDFLKKAALGAVSAPFCMSLGSPKVWAKIPPGLKIVAVDTFVVGTSNCFIKIRTNEGVYGVGEANNTNGMIRAVEEIIKASVPHMIGKDPTNLEFLYQGLYHWNRWHVGQLFTSMLSSVDMACWDIIGKLADMPVYKLLGGAAREKIRLYCAASGKSGVERARSIGYNAMKTGPGPISGKNAAGKSYVPMPWDLKRAVTQIEEARIAGGDNFDILIDFHGQMDPEMSLEFCKAVEPYRIFWAEEAIQLEGTNDTLKWLSDRMNVPLCMGERNFMKWGVVDMINKRTVSYINMDLSRCGGISEFKKVAAMAEAQFIKVSPHRTEGKIGQMANFHCSMNCPNSVIQEMGQWADEPFLKKTDWWTDDLWKGHRFQIKDGFATVPDVPGLGIDFDEKVAREHPFVPSVAPESVFADGTPTDN